MMSPHAAGVMQIADDEEGTMQDGRASSSETTELVLRAQAGETYAFEQLMTCCQRQVLCTAARILHRFEDAKDASQEVFLKLFRYLPRIKPETVRPWLYRVTITVCRDMAKKNERLPTAALEDDAEESQIAATGIEKIEAGVDLEEQREILVRALQSLPFRERAALVLRDIEGLSTEVTARVLGSSPTTVRSQISSARVKVRRYGDRIAGREK